MAWLCNSYDSATQLATDCQVFDINSFAITGTQASLIITAIAGYFLTMWLLRRLRFTF